MTTKYRYLVIGICLITFCCKSDQKKSNISSANTPISNCESCSSVHKSYNNEISIDSIIAIAKDKIVGIRSLSLSNLKKYTKSNTDSLSIYPHFVDKSLNRGNYSYYFNSSKKLEYISVNANCYKILLCAFDTVGYRLYVPLVFDYANEVISARCFINAFFITKESWNQALFMGFYHEINRASISTVMTISKDFKSCNNHFYGRERSKPRGKGRSSLFTYNQHYFDHEYKSSNSLNIDTLNDVSDLLNALNSFEIDPQMIEYKPGLKECGSEGYFWIYSGNIIYSD